MKIIAQLPNGEMVTNIPLSHFRKTQILFDGFWREIIEERNGLPVINARIDVEVINKKRPLIDTTIIAMNKIHNPNRNIKDFQWDSVDGGIVNYDDTSHRFRVSTFDGKLTVFFLGKQEVL